VQISDYQSLRKTPLPKRQRHRDPLHWVWAWFGTTGATNVFGLPAPPVS
jgi:hypothetical protein